MDDDMEDKYRNNDYDFDFLQGDAPPQAEAARPDYKVILADDDAEVHHSTTLVLKRFTFEGAGITFVHAYNTRETLQAIDDHPDAAILLLDVVMDEKDSGLKIIRYIREERRNSLLRILLRTGQPGEAPEERIVVEYDINDYLLKTDTTVQRLFTSLYQAFRAYRDLVRIDNNRRGLEKILLHSSDLFVQKSFQDFFSSILQAITDLKSSTSTVCIAESPPEDMLAYVSNQEGCQIIAATGEFQPLLGRKLDDVEDLEFLRDFIRRKEYLGKPDLIEVGNGFLIWKDLGPGYSAFIFINNRLDLYDLDLVRIFLVNYTLALHGFVANQRIKETQFTLINTLGEAIESRSHETANHVKRTAELTAFIAEQLDYTDDAIQTLKIAATMHDVGKIGISDQVLTKPASLTEEEYERMKIHTIIGHKIFEHSRLPVLREAASICLNHHEWYDGTGYPNHLTRDSIPLSARIVALVDVMDSLAHRRYYKEAWPMDKVFAYIAEHKGTQFDPELVDIVLTHKDRIVELFEQYRD
ncbi:HD domain-containing phosphohydrolase [Anaerotalea alkaliphila]|uniref:Stage 0 sporulation protein A homolog n=1 Tax=Anaerotalea alkaliphila TaxID=2662126 RepID=A0A7X5HVJ2_9FIRM|nr:HD domain-containing phosphohydrolase [Anaerotalea alkaliphila]NDL67450.1 DUF3369 domain-containing protein [Anaerotalea alkaliphila]